jgi:hypothetical protein
MSITGKITAMMETWPLQLAVETTSGRYHVSLQPETIVSQAGRAAEVTALRPNQRVQISGYSIEDNTLTAESIELLEN